MVRLPDGCTSHRGPSPPPSSGNRSSAQGWRSAPPLNSTRAGSRSHTAASSTSSNEASDRKCTRLAILPQPIQATRTLSIRFAPLQAGPGAGLRPPGRSTRRPTSRHARKRLPGWKPGEATRRYGPEAAAGCSFRRFRGAAGSAGCVWWGPAGAARPGAPRRSGPARGPPLPVRRGAAPEALPPRARLAPPAPRAGRAAPRPPSPARWV